MLPTIEKYEHRALHCAILCDKNVDFPQNDVNCISIFIKFDFPKHLKNL